MKAISAFTFALLLFSFACNNDGNQGSSTGSADTLVPSRDWKFGVALWTFHDLDLPHAIEKVDSAGLKYIEPNTFQRAGKELNDSLILQLSPAGIERVKAMIAEKGLICESIYIVGDSTVASWKSQFEIAQRLGVKFVTTEPPLNLWDQIDSLAGVYGVNVAIHDHWRGVSRYWSPDSVLAAIQNHPHFGACADLGHWPKSGIDPVDGVRKLAGHIIGIHFKDIAAFDNPKLIDVQTGTGVVNFPGVFMELKKQAFNGHIYIERDSIEPGGNLPSVRREIDYYKQEVGKLEKRP